MLQAAILVFIGGGLGSLLRFGISKLFQQMWSTQLPVATLLANILACTVLALALYASQRFDSAAWVRFGVLIGFCGGLSTFSTFSLETFQLIKQGMLGYAAGNVVFSVAACLAVLYYFTK